MALITKLLALFSLALSVNAFTAPLALSSRALPGPHISHNILNHNRAVPRVVVQAVLTVAVPATPKRKPPRDKFKSSCNSTASSSSTSSAHVASVPVNAAPSTVLTTTFSQAASDLALTSSFSSSDPTQAPELTQQIPLHFYTLAFHIFHEPGSSCADFYIQQWFVESWAQLPEWHSKRTWNILRDWPWRM